MNMRMNDIFYKFLYFITLNQLHLTLKMSVIIYLLQETADHCLA